MRKDKLKVDVTLANGRVVPIEMTTEPWNYDADLAKLKEIYGENNVEVKR